MIEFENEKIDIVTKIKMWIIIFEVLVIGKAFYKIVVCISVKVEGEIVVSGVLDALYQLLIELGVCLILEWMGELIITLKGIKSRLKNKE